MKLSIALTLATTSVVATLPPVITNNGKFYDISSNEVNFRGVNVVYKDDPYLPISPSFDSNLSFLQDDIDLLKSLGVNLIRLGVMWPGVNPTEGSTDEDYLQKVDDMIQLCADNDVYVLVDPHQDELNPLWCGEGAPDWWVKKYVTKSEERSDELSEGLSRCAHNNYANFTFSCLGTPPE